jgi:drug/metabolite transporter (DMT)-like permease
MLIFEEPTIAGIYSARYAILYCGVLSAGVAYTLQVVAQKKADPTFAAIAFSSESVFSAIGGALFGIDNISLIGYIGCAFITFGIIIAQLVFDGKKKNKSSDDVCEDKKERIGE